MTRNTLTAACPSPSAVSMRSPFTGRSCRVDPAPSPSASCGREYLGESEANSFCYLPSTVFHGNPPVPSKDPACAQRKEEADPAWSGG